MSVCTVTSPDLNRQGSSASRIVRFVHPFVSAGRRGGRSVRRRIVV